MSHILILLRGESRNYRHADGTPIFASLKAKVSIFTDGKNESILNELEGDCSGQKIKWRNPADILEFAKEIHDQNPLTAIAAFGEEDVELAAYLRNELAIEGTTIDTAKNFRNKVTMKKHLIGSESFRIPNFKDDFDASDIKSYLDKYGKIVIKPKDGLGSKGVQIVSNFGEIEDWLSTESSLSDYELEEFIEGTLYHVNSVVRDGTVVFTSSAPYVPEMGNIDFSEGRPFVSIIETDSSIQERLNSVASEVVKKLGFLKGVIHLEVFLTPEGNYVFCEVGARIGGGGIVNLIEVATGIHLGRELLNAELNIPLNIKVNDKNRFETVHGLIGLRNHIFGMYTGIPSCENFEKKWIHRSEFLISNGDTALPASHCTDYLAFFIVSGPDYEQALERILMINNIYKNLLTIEPL